MCVLIRLCCGQQVPRPAVRFAVVLWGEPNDKCRSLLDCPVLSYAEVLAQGHRASEQFQSAPLSSDQLATIVYTSGTTGNPKVPGPDQLLCSLVCNAFSQTVCTSFSSYFTVAKDGTPPERQICMQGVMLTHGNLKYQLDNLSFFLKPKPGERSLSLLPPWHIYERSCGYYLFSRACTQVSTPFKLDKKFSTLFSLACPPAFLCAPEKPSA